MIILRNKQKNFGWWGDLNKKMVLRSAKQGQKWNPSWSKYISEEEYNSNLPLGIRASIKKKTREALELEQVEILKENFPKLSKELEGLVKFLRDKSIKDKYPQWGEGDEYPRIYFNMDWEKLKKPNFIPVIFYGIGFQETNFLGINPKGEYWCNSLQPSLRLNLKKELLSDLENSLKEYTQAKINDEYMWNDEEYDQVIDWIKTLIGGVKKYL